MRVRTRNSRNSHNAIPCIHRRASFYESNENCNRLCASWEQLFALSNVKFQLMKKSSLLCRKNVYFATAKLQHCRHVWVCWCSNRRRRKTKMNFLKCYELFNTNEIFCELRARAFYRYSSYYCYYYSHLCIFSITSPKVRQLARDHIRLSGVIEWTDNSIDSEIGPKRKIGWTHYELLPFVTMCRNGK